jgi:DNA-directed RNA polymerase II subunit RPB1
MSATRRGGKHSQQKSQVLEIVGAKNEPKPQLKSRREKIRGAQLEEVRPVLSTQQNLHVPSKIDKSLRERKLRDLQAAQVMGFTFSIMDQDALQEMKVCEVTDPSITEGSRCVLDPAMGPSSIMGECKTCGAGFTKCPGHFGVIKLQIPIYNPVFSDKKNKICAKILTMFCYECWRASDQDYFAWSQEEIAKINKRIMGTTKEIVDGVEVDIPSHERVIRKNAEQKEKIKPKNAPVDKRPVIRPLFDVEAIRSRHGNVNLLGLKKFVEIYKLTKGQKCPTHQCQKGVTTYKQDDDGRIFQIVGKDKDVTKMSLNPNVVKRFFTAIDEDVDENWTDLIGFNQNKLSSLILDYIPVLPNIFRPKVVVGEGKTVIQNMLSDKYSNIVTLNESLAKKGIKFDDLEAKKGESSNKFPIQLIGGARGNKDMTATEIYRELYKETERLFFGSETSYDDDNGFQSNKPITSLRMFIDGKQGTFRGEILGKRSDFGGRTVVIGDPEIDVDEVGITESFAERVTRPIIIESQAEADEWNAKLPIKNPDGTLTESNIIRIQRGYQTFKVTGEEQLEIRVGDVLAVKIKNGDTIILTRQPVLHKGGMMAFKVRLMPKGTGNVLRINPSVTTPYNADFDGDEMNFSIPQSTSVIAEIMKTMFVHNCVRGDSSTPWLGLIQNAIIAGERMTQPDVVVPEDLYFGCMSEFTKIIEKRNAGNVFRITSDMREHVRQLKSAGVLPFSGRGLFSFFLPRNLKYTRGVKKAEDIFVEQGILYSGIITGADLGRTPNGLVDTILELYGANMAITFLSAVQHGLRWWLENTGFSVGPSDCVLKEDLEKSLKPRESMDKLIGAARKRVAELYEGYDSERSSEIERKSIEQAVRSILGALRDKIVRMVRAGGVDVSSIHKTLNANSSNQLLHEAVALAIKKEEDGDSRVDLEKFLQTLKTQRKSENVDFDIIITEIHLLNNVYKIIASHELLSEFPFSEASFASGDALRDEYLQELKIQADIRSQLTGADKFTNSFLQMVYSGAKGSEMNIVQVLGSLGQQEIDGDRIFGHLAGDRVLPHMQRKNMDPVNQGFCGNSLSQGLNPVELYQYAMATRTNVVETDLKPSETGTFYRKAYSLMEDNVTYPDGSVRDENGRIIQFAYGGDFFDGRRLMKVNDEAQFVNVQMILNELRSKSELFDMQFK